MITPNPGVFARRVSDEMVILDSRTEMYLELTPSAAMMWEIAAAASDRSVALTQLTAKWPNESPERLAGDFDALIADVVARGLATLN